MKISVIGAGYVGLSLAILIAQKHKVILFDIDRNKINNIKKKKSPIKDKEIEEYLLTKKLDLFTTTESNDAYKDSDYIIIATPTDYSNEKGSFDTSSVENVISEIQKVNPKSIIIIKSTVPLGFTELMQAKFDTKKIIFSPEFLREGSALYDNLYPSRIVIGGLDKEAETFSEILKDCSKLKNDKIKCFFMKSKEAEAVKLFSNTFLAMRVSYFNELDTFSQINNISTKKIIEGVSSDPRIGDYYNNPSFGYGGYCLPKDTKQLFKNFENVPSNLIKAIIESNVTRKNFIFESILGKKPNSIGIYRLTMKNNSDNYRESAVFDIIQLFIKNNIVVNIYEPNLKYEIINANIIKDVNLFISKSDIILANRNSSELENVKDKVYTRDLFGEN